MHYVYFSFIILGELVLIALIMGFGGLKSKHPRLLFFVLVLCSILLTVLLARFTKI